MVILITGASGFLGRNLIEKIEDMGKENHTILKYSSKNSDEQLNSFIGKSDFIYHFAAIHRPKDEYDYFKINVGLTKDIIKYKENHKNNCPILFTSSIQANDDSLYGKSKLECEEIIKSHSATTGAKSIIYRLSNTFGKWATPHHHSVVATFCYNISRNLPVYISNTEHVMHFHYIDDVIETFAAHPFNDVKSNADGFFRIDKSYDITLGQLYDTLVQFRDEDFANINMDDKLNRNLYETYKSYCEDTDKVMNHD